MFPPIIPRNPQIAIVANHMVHTTTRRKAVSQAKRPNKSVRYYLLRASRRWRELTASKRMLPQFIIAGAPKCGTTALYRYLLSHPQVLAPFPPSYEIGYFSEYYKHELDWYRARFPLNATASRRSRRAGGKAIVTCEHTPFYVMHPLAAERIAATLPDVKIIILLRNPVDRAFSHYQHEFRSGAETLSFREAVAMEDQRIAGEVVRMQSDPDYHSPEYVRHAYLHQGEYRSKVERFFNHLDPANVKIIQSERLFFRTQEVFDEVVDFLHLDPRRLDGIKPVNAGSYAPLDKEDPELAHQLRDHFRSHNQALYSYLGTDFGW